MLALLGKKLGQTRVYDKNGNAIPVTVVLAGPNRVVQVKTLENDGYKAVQLGFDDQKNENRVANGLLGHFKKNGVQVTKRTQEFRDFPKEVKAGDSVGVDVFAVGDFVDAIGYTKGR